MTNDAQVTQIMTRESVSRTFSPGDILRGRYRLDAKRRTARELLGSYQQLVAKCQSPRFTREAERLARELGLESVPSA